MIKNDNLADVMFFIKSIAMASKDIKHITEKDIEDIAYLLLNNITFEKWKDKDLSLLVCGIIKGYIYKTKLLKKENKNE